MEQAHAAHQGRAGTSLLGPNKRWAVPIAVGLFALIFVAIFLSCRLLECIFGEFGGTAGERPLRKGRYGSRSLRSRIAEASRIDKKVSQAQQKSTKED